VAGSKAVHRTTNELAHEAECNYAVMVSSAKTNSASPSFAASIQLGRDATERETRKQKDKRQLRLVWGQITILLTTAISGLYTFKDFSTTFFGPVPKGNKNVCCRRGSD
jgi:hypothetical protein